MTADPWAAVLSALAQADATWAEVAAREEVARGLSAGVASWLELGRGLPDGRALLRAWPAAGCTPRDVVARPGRARLLRYRMPARRRTGRGATSAARRGRGRLPPLVICFALVNRPEILDLRPGRSLVRKLLEGGREVYLLDWGDPAAADRSRRLEEYLDEDLGASLRWVAQRHGRVPDLLGVCQGGTLSLCWTAMHPRSVGRLITLTPPVDFHTPGDLLSRWVRRLDVSELAAGPNVPGVLLALLFLALRPMRLGPGKYLELLRRAGDARALEEFLRMERWVLDGPDQPARALAQFVELFYQRNALVRGGLRLGGRQVRLERIRQPVLNIYATRDHIVPPQASSALGGLLPDGAYRAHAVEAGHVGLYTASAALEETAALILAWLAGSEAPARPRRPVRRTTRKRRLPG